MASGASVGEGHGSGNRGTLTNGTLAVVDVGCTVDGYVSDFTRTLPVGGRFSPALRPIYEGVLAAQRAAEVACRPGVSLVPRRTEGGQSLDGIAREVLKRELGHDRMGHALGHTVGLWVHDVRTGGPLQPGMVITLEPGDYGPTAGVRIEDTYLVTETGCERLTEGFPAESGAGRGSDGTRPRASAVSLDPGASLRRAALQPALTESPKASRNPRAPFTVTRSARVPGLLHTQPTSSSPAVRLTPSGPARWSRRSVQSRQACPSSRPSASSRSPSSAPERCPARGEAVPDPVAVDEPAFPQRVHQADPQLAREVAVAGPRAAEGGLLGIPGRAAVRPGGE